MNTIKIAYVQWPDGLLPDGAPWQEIVREVGAAQADILVTNEMPFGSWLPEHADYHAGAAREWADLHETALDALGRLDAGAVISSRPILSDDRLVNESFVLEQGRYRYLHHKKFFPQETGFHEETWFARGRDGFECVDVGGIKLGILLCTELFFNEHARAYGRQGADLILTPRASGTSLHRWTTAGALAAIVSGATFVSSNRSGTGPLGQTFGGNGFAMSPDGAQIGRTTPEATLAVATIDLDVTRATRLDYPRYVREL